MLIFNTTFVVSDRAYGPWLKWVREQHIPFMLEWEGFSKPQLAKVFSQDNQDGTSYSVQFHVDNLETLENWHIQHARSFEQKFAEKFGDEVIFFATILEIIE